METDQDHYNIITASVTAAVVVFLLLCLALTALTVCVVVTKRRIKAKRERGINHLHEESKGSNLPLHEGVSNTMSSHYYETYLEAVRDSEINGEVATTQFHVSLL